MIALIAQACGNKSANQTNGNNVLDFDQAFLSAQELYELGNLDSSEAMLNLAYALDSTSYDLNLFRADVLFAQKNFVGSLSSYKKCLAINNNDPKVWARLGKIYLNQNDHKSALKYFNEAISRDQSFADAYIGRAIIFGKKDKMDQAYLSLQTAIDFDPNNVNALLTMAQWKLADSAQIAIQYLTNAIRIDSTNADFYYQRAKAFERFETYKSAELDYQKALKLDSANVNYAFNMAYFYYQFEVWNQALHYFNYCLELKNDDKDVLLGKALCLKELNNLEQAKETLQQLLQIDPNDADAIRELENLR